ncbi:MAG: universal stress protein [Deltaproteobacteria bacterium]|nr:universal stress protein [Deltaproteobacteria bacterium]
MNILVCYDETEASQAALKIGVQHAKALDGKAYVITSMIGGTKDNIEDNKKAESGLKYAQSVLEKNGISCKTHLLVRGLSSGEDILQFADENDINEIIIGIKKTSKVGKLVFGSTAQHVILESNCPVVTVK